MKQVIKVRSHVGNDAKDECLKSGSFKAMIVQTKQQNRQGTIFHREFGKFGTKVVEIDGQNHSLRQAIHTLLVSVGMRAVQSQPKTKLPEPNGTLHTETVEH